MNVPWVCYTCHALLYGGVGLAYRAWNSVVFLLVTGIAKPLMSVKNERTSRFFVYIRANHRKIKENAENPVKSRQN